jgi:DNA-binding transcriptional LysR family regulator
MFVYIAKYVSKFAKITISLGVPMSLFSVSSEDCEFLLMLEKAETLFDLAELMKRDVSVVSRRLSKLSLETELVKKVGQKWIISSKGRELIAWTKRAIIEQQNVMLLDSKLTIATTREFASRILIPHLKLVRSEFKNIEILTSEGESEELLLNHKADLAIDCGHPHHPDIRFKKILKERMVVCSSKAWAKKNNFILKGDDYLHFNRNNITNLQEDLKLKLSPLLSFNDLSSLRQGIIQGMGFGYLPYYVVADLDLAQKIYIYPVKHGSLESFGIWRRHDYQNEKAIKLLEKLLESVNLE